MNRFSWNPTHQVDPREWLSLPNYETPANNWWIFPGCGLTHSELSIRRTHGQLPRGWHDPGMNHFPTHMLWILGPQWQSYHSCDYQGERVKTLGIGHHVVGNGVTCGVGPPLDVLFKAFVVVPYGLIMATVVWHSLNWEVSVSALFKDRW